MLFVNRYVTRSFYAIALRVLTSRYMLLAMERSWKFPQNVSDRKCVVLCMVPRFPGVERRSAKIPTNQCITADGSSGICQEVS